MTLCPSCRGRQEHDRAGENVHAASEITRRETARARVRRPTPRRHAWPARRASPGWRRRGGPRCGSIPPSGARSPRSTARRRPRRPAGAGPGPPGRTGFSGGRDQARRRWWSRGGTGRRGIARVGQDRRPCAASTPRRRIRGRPVGNPGAKPFYPRIGGQRRGRQVQIRYVVRPGGRGRLRVREGCSPHRCCRDGRSGLWCQGSWAQAFVLLYR